MQTMRANAQGMRMPRVAALLAATAVGALSATAGAAEPGQPPSTPPMFETDTSPDTWEGTGWRMQGRTVRRSAGWLVAEDVEVTSTLGAPSRRWDVRADRMLARVSPLGRISTLWARGNVRIVGAPPVYAVGDEAVSFRPRRSIQVFSRGGAAALIAKHGRLAGRRVTVDLHQTAATVFAIGDTTHLSRPSPE